MDPRGNWAPPYFFLVLADSIWDLASWVHPERIRILLGGTGGWAPWVYLALMALAVVITR